MSAALAEKIRARIAAEGPLTLASFMEMALADPQHGYYRTRDPFGAAGDFVTAPEVSQMFGEMIGLWAVHMWTELGRPDPFLLIEPGPGRGTLMADMLRAGRVVPGFAEAARVCLVETSPALRARQRDLLSRQAKTVAWYDDLESLPPGPSILVANEFLDALPIRQFERTHAGWRERLVGMDAEGRLRWQLGEAEVADAVPPSLRSSQLGAIVETSAERAAVAAAISARLVAAPGGALIVDYGYAGPAVGDTFQAVRQHRFADPFDNPGDADLTAHVDFSALVLAARQAGAQAFGPISQAQFLFELGIATRAERLKAASPGHSGEVDLALARLIGPGQMGALFKAVALASPGLAPPPPFAPGGAD